MMTYSHVVTGATGFVGSALVLKLLQDTNDTITCIVRSKQSQTAQMRLLQKLHYAAELYALPKSIHKEIDTRCNAIEGDLTHEI